MTVQTFEAELAGLLTQLDSNGRRALAREIAKSLRTGQQERIRMQQNPDGSAFEARKPQLRDRKGAVRRQMFRKLRTARWLKADSQADAAVVSFVGQVGRIAAVHQYGLRDKVSNKGPEVQYAARQLLGFTDANIEKISDQVLTHLSR